MTRPVKINNPPCQLAEFVNGTDTLDDNVVAQSNILQHEGAINHGNILNIGTNSHSDIDLALTFALGHFSAAPIHFLENTIQHGNILGIGTNDHATIDAHIADPLIHTNDHNDLINNGLSTGHLPFPYARFYAIENSPTTTTGTAFVTHLNLAANILDAGTYKLSWSYGFASNNTGSDIICRLIAVGAASGGHGTPEIVHYLRLEFKDSGGSDARTGGFSGTDQENSTGGFIDVELNPGIQNFNLEVGSSGGGTVRTMYDARLELIRVA